MLDLCLVLVISTPMKMERRRQYIVYFTLIAIVALCSSEEEEEYEQNRMGKLCKWKLVVLFHGREYQEVCSQIEKAS